MTIIIEPIGVMRSDAIVQSQPSPTAEIDGTIERLKQGDKAALARYIDNSIQQLQTARAISQVRINQYVLVKIGTETIPKLLPLLQDKDESARSRASTVLGNIGTAAIPHLIPLLEHRDKNVRSSVTTTLGKMSGSSKVIIPHLIPLLKDNELEVRSSAAAALKKLGYQP
jgi:HEAT repeat protein